MLETVFCDSCKNVQSLQDLKKPKIKDVIVACPNGMYPTTFRFAIFKCSCGAKNQGSSIRKATS